MKTNAVAAPAAAATNAGGKYPSESVALTLTTHMHATQLQCSYTVWCCVQTCPITMTMDRIPAFAKRVKALFAYIDQSIDERNEVCVLAPTLLCRRPYDIC